MAGSADIGIRVFLDDAASSGLGVLGSSFSRFGYILGGVGQQWGALNPVMQNAALITAGSAIAFGLFAGTIIASVKAAADLQSAMTQVELNVQGASAVMPQLTSLVEQLGNQSVYSSQELADAFSALGQHGITAADILNSQIGPAVVNLSEAMGQNEATGAANLLSIALQQYGGSASDAMQYANLLDIAFHNGIPDVNSLTAAITQSASYAHTAQMSFQDYTATLAIMAQYTGSGATAGVALRNALLGIMNPTATAVAAMGELGTMMVNNTSPAIDEIIAKLEALGGKSKTVAEGYDGTVKSLSNLWTQANRMNIGGISSSFLQWGLATKALSDQFYNAAGRMLPFQDIIKIIARDAKEAGLNAEQTQQLLMKMFNQTGGKAVLAMVENEGPINSKSSAKNHIAGMSENNQPSNDVAQKYANLTLQQENQNRVIQDAATYFGTFRSQVKALGTTFQDFLANVGTPFLGQLTGWLRGVNNFLGGINQLMLKSPQLGQLITSFLEIGAAVSGVGMVVGILVLVFGTMSGIVPIVMGITLGIILLSLGLSALWKYFNLGSVFSSIFKQIGLAVSDSCVALNPFETAVRSIVTVAKALGSSVMAAFSGLGPMFKTLLHSLAMSGALQDLQKAWQQLQQAIKPILPILEGIGIGLAVVVGGAIALVIGLLSGLVSAVIGAFVGMLPGAIRVVVGVFQVLGSAINLVVSIVKTIYYVLQGFAFLLEGKPTQATKAFGNALGSLGAVVTSVIGILNGIVNIIRGVFTAAFGGLVGLVSGFVTGIIGFFTHLADVLVGHSIIPDMWNAILHWFTSIPSKIVGLITGFVGRIIGGFMHLGQGVLSLVTSMFHHTDTTQQQMVLQSKAHFETMQADALASKIKEQQSVIAQETLMADKIVQEIAACKDEHKKHMLEMQLDSVLIKTREQTETVKQEEIMHQAIIAKAKDMQDQAKKLAEQQKTGVVQQFQGLVTTTVDLITTWPVTLLGIIADFGIQWIGKLLGLKQGTITHMQDMVNSVVETVTTLPGKLLTIGANMLSSFTQGILSGLGGLGNAMSQVGSKIMSFLPHSPADEGPLSQIDKPMPAMMSLMAKGIVGGTGLISSAMTSVGNTIMSHPAMNHPAMAGSVGGPGGTRGNAPSTQTIEIHLDSDVLGKAVNAYDAKVLRMNGNGRRMR
jgi:phage-related protein